MISLPAVPINAPGKDWSGIFAIKRMSRVSMGKIDLLLLTLRQNILTIIRAALITAVNLAAEKVRMSNSRHNLQHKVTP